MLCVFQLVQPAFVQQRSDEQVTVVVGIAIEHHHATARSARRSGSAGRQARRDRRRPRLLGTKSNSARPPAARRARRGRARRGVLPLGYSPAAKVPTVARASLPIAPQEKPSPSAGPPLGRGPVGAAVVAFVEGADHLDPALGANPVGALGPLFLLFLVLRRRCPRARASSATFDQHVGRNDGQAGKGLVFFGHLGRDARRRPAGCGRDRPRSCWPPDKPTPDLADLPSPDS